MTTPNDDELCKRLRTSDDVSAMTEAAARIEALIAERDAALAEVNEQARLNGMGSEREARLIAERDAAVAENRSLRAWVADDQPAYDSGIAEGERRATAAIVADLKTWLEKVAAMRGLFTLLIERYENGYHVAGDHITEGQAMTADDWQPIETAPFGTPLIDVWGYDPTDAYTGPYRIPDCWKREDGVWFSMRFGELKRTVLTHWRHRPPPPTT